MRIVTPGFHEESFAKSAFRWPYRKHLMPNQGKHYIPMVIISGAGCMHILGKRVAALSGPLSLVPAYIYPGGEATHLLRLDHHRTRNS